MMFSGNLFGSMTVISSFLSNTHLLMIFFVLALVLVTFTIVRLVVQYKGLLATKIGLKNYLSAISANSRMEEIHNGDFNYAIKALSRSLLTTIKTDDVAYWEFDRESQSLKLHPSAKGFNPKLIRKSAMISKDDFPTPIEWFESGTIFYAEETLKDQILEELVQYLYQDFPYTSSLACPIILEGELAGVIITESIKKRSWHHDDIMFIKSIADNISQAYRSQERMNMMLEMQQQQQYIQEMNMTLEQQVIVGEQEVESVNEKLAEYAYINAHQMRGPICRLQGLDNLLKKTSTKDEILELVGHMHESVKELNQLTNNSSRILEESHYFKSIVNSKHHFK